ncbi:hypothetical protein FF1_001663 [Malus domestica]
MAGGKKTIFSSLDNAKTQLYHYKAIVIAGMGFSPMLMTSSRHHCRHKTHRPPLLLRPFKEQAPRSA